MATDVNGIIEKAQESAKRMADQAADMITKAQMDAYRSGAFLQRREAYGEAAAIQWEAEAKQRHEDAREIHRQQAAKAKAA